uniref:Uncharacterized protein n=1 Tax=Fagus sylvatica TaxID=28930 RepID=A0A2N9HSL2_FAGSY
MRGTELEEGVFAYLGKFAENGLGPPPIEGFVSPDSVLHRLSAELYSVIYPAIHTWEAVRGRMAANEAEWPLPLSEELPEGLSDESGGVTREVSSEAVPSTSGSRPFPRIDRSWKAMSYFSKFRQDDVDRIRRRYQIPDDVVIRIPDSDERACCPKYEGDVAFYEADLKAGLRFPIQPFVRELLDFLSLAPGQVKPKWLAHDHLVHGDVEGRPRGYPRPTGFGRTGTSLCAATIGRGYRKKALNDFVGVRRTWGTPSSSALDRPLLNSIWQGRISRILDIEDRRYNIFIDPDLLATFSLGPVPSSAVKALVRANKKRITTMKLNKSRLKQLAQSGEVAAAPVSLKRKKPDEGSSKRAEEAPSRPSVPVVTPPVIPTAVLSVQKTPTVILVDSDLTASVGGFYDKPESSRRHGQSESRHISSGYGRVCCGPHGRPFATYGSFPYAGVLLWRKILLFFEPSRIADEEEMKNAKRAVMELTRERKEALAEVERLEKELKARDDDVKAAVEAKDKAVADFKHLVGQIEGAKEAVVSEFRASEAFKDINTRYFLSGFEAFRKQAVQRFPGL